MKKINSFPHKCKLRVKKKSLAFSSIDNNSSSRIKTWVAPERNVPNVETWSIVRRLALKKRALQRGFIMLSAA